MERVVTGNVAPLLTRIARLSCRLFGHAWAPEDSGHGVQGEFEILQMTKRCTCCGEYDVQTVAVPIPPDTSCQ